MAQPKMQILLRNDTSHIRHEKHGAFPKEASSNSGGNDGAEQLAAALNVTLMIGNRGGENQYLVMSVLNSMPQLWCSAILLK